MRRLVQQHFNKGRYIVISRGNNESETFEKEGPGKTSRE